MIARRRREDRPYEAAARREADIDAKLADRAGVAIAAAAIRMEDAVDFLGGAEEIADAAADIAGELAYAHAAARIRLVVDICFAIGGKVGRGRNRNGGKRPQNQRGRRKNLFHDLAPQAMCRSDDRPHGPDGGMVHRHNKTAPTPALAGLNGEGPLLVPRCGSLAILAKNGLTVQRQSSSAHMRVSAVR
jgi:hypothetical protein